MCYTDLLVGGVGKSAVAAARDLDEGVGMARASPAWSLPAFDPVDLAAGWGQGVSSVDDLPSAESTESFASESTLLGSGEWNCNKHKMVINLSEQVLCSSVNFINSNFFKKNYAF